MERASGGVAHKEKITSGLGYETSPRWFVALRASARTGILEGKPGVHKKKIERNKLNRG